MKTLLLLILILILLTGCDQHSQAHIRAFLVKKYNTEEIANLHNIGGLSYDSIYIVRIKDGSILQVYATGEEVRNEYVILAPKKFE